MFSINFIKIKFAILTICNVLITSTLMSQVKDNKTSENKANPISISGQLSIGSGLYFAKGIENRFSPITWMINGNPTLNIYKFSFPFSFTFTEQNKDYTHPFTRYGVSPTYKNLKLHLGHRSMNFNPYTLSGRIFFGAGIEFKYKWFKIAAMRGRYTKATRIDTTYLYDQSILLKPNTIKPAYEQWGHGVKIGFGKSKHHFETMFFRGKDKMSNLDVDFTKANIKPAENISIGINTQITFYKGITWTTQSGGSIYTKDMTASLIEGLYIPGLDSSKSKKITNWYKLRSSSQISYAGESALNFGFRYFGISFSVKRVMPEYKSLGIFYIQGDMDQYLISPYFKLFKNKLSLTGSIGSQKDNLLKTKATTSKSNIGSAHVSIQPNQKMGLDVNFSNFGLVQNAFGNVLISDSFLIHQNNKSLSITPRYTIVNQDKIMNVLFVASYQELLDLNPYTAQFSNSKNLNMNFSYLLNQIKQQYTISPTLFYNSSSTSAFQSTNFGISVSGSKKFIKNKLNVSSGFSYFQNAFNGSKSGSTFSINTFLTYLLKKEHALTLNMQWLQNNASLPGYLNKFSETRFNLAYGFQFNSIKKQVKP